MSQTSATVSAISVVDLARELYQREVLTLLDIEAVSPSLIPLVHRLIAQKDMSDIIESRFPETWLVQLWHLAQERAPDSHIGVDIGAHISPEASGLVNHLLQNCDTIGEALQVYLDYVPLVNAAETWTRQYYNQNVILTFHFCSEFTYPRCAVERSIVSLICWAMHYTQRRFAINAVRFTYAKPSYTNELKALLPCPVFFDQEQTQIELPKTSLEIPLVSHQPYLKKMLSERAQSIVKRAVSKTPFTDQVRSLIQRDLTHFSAQTAVTDALHMSRSTLSRKLKEEGTSFVSVLDSVRRQVAQEYSHLATKQLIDKLGFNDESAYYKAKRKWSGDV